MGDLGVESKIFLVCNCWPMIRDFCKRRTRSSVARRRVGGIRQEPDGKLPDTNQVTSTEVLAV
jgi:hypothetical protein